MRLRLRSMRWSKPRSLLPLRLQTESLDP
jgi:hypothetical protein